MYIDRLSKTLTWPEVIKPFSMLNLAKHKIYLAHKLKQTIVGILTFDSLINTTAQRLKAINFFFYQYFSFYEQLKFRA